MKSLLPEFEIDGDGPKRLLITISGEKICLAALRPELLKLGAEAAVDGGLLTAVLPPAADVDSVLPAVAAALERVLAVTNRPVGAALLETRMVPARFRPAMKRVRLGERFHVLPAGAAGGDDDTILLGAGSVFGSGLHPSTRLAVRAMDDLARLPRGFPAGVLDVGTGSGLLAMIAARRGAKEVTGIDISTEAVQAANENLALNGLEKRVLITATPLARLTARFELILANLTISVHLRLAAALLARLRPGGEMILSGLQGRQQDEIARFWQAKGLKLINVYEEGLWRALWLRGE